MSVPAKNYFETVGLLKPEHYNLQIGAPGPKALKKLATLFEVSSTDCSVLTKVVVKKPNPNKPT